MPKKIIKLLQASVPKFYKQNIVLFDFDKELKFRKPQFKKLKRASHAVFKNIFRRKQKPGETLLGIFRYLNASIDANFSQYPKITLFWKAFIPRTLREEATPKTTTPALNAPANDAIAPKQSREFSGRSGWRTCDVESIQSQSKKRKKPPKRKTEDEVLGISSSPTKGLNGVAEQKLYTQENLNKGPDVAAPSNELPPPQKCRLSCPLPPAEFCSTDFAEFRSNYQSPNVRFSSLPIQFLPEPKPVEGKPEGFTPKDVHLSSDVSQKETTDFPPAAIPRNSKNYTDVVSPVPQAYDSLTQETPKMKALLFEPSTLQLNYDAVNAPIKIFKDEVLIQVAYSGVCGSDLFITEGKVSCGDSPVILGHEISGTVYAVGSKVDHVKPGDKIAVNAYTACCLCRYCSRGLFSACLKEGINNSIGISKHGGWAEYVVVKKSQVHKVPEQLELDQAALIQPLSCVLCAMSKLRMFHEMDILVQGLGVSGCLWTSVLHSQGYKNVVVSDKKTKRRHQFESLQTNYLHVPSEDIGKLTVDLVVECTGSSNSIEKCFNILNPNGQMCFFGKPYPVTEVRCLPYEIIQKEITIVGNAGNAFHFSKAIDVATTLGRRYLDFEKLGVKTFDLENFREAFQQKKAEEVSKIIFKLDS